MGDAAWMSLNAFVSELGLVCNFDHYWKDVSRDLLAIRTTMETLPLLARLYCSVHRFEKIAMTCALGVAFDINSPGP